MGILNNIRNWLLEPLLDGEERKRLETVDLYRGYRGGKQRRFLKIKTGQFDDNLIINFTGLVIDRSVSLLFGKGLTIDLPGDDETPEDVYLAAVLDANKQQILFHSLGLLGSEQGTCYLKIIPDGVLDLRSGDEERTLPRIVAVDPAWVTVDTNPHDKEDVIRYVTKYYYNRGDDQVAYKEIIERDDGIEYNDNNEPIQARDVRWTIEEYEFSKSTGNEWQQIGETQIWEYPFPPLLHWQNLPDPTSVYGLPDVTDDVIEIQDRLNFLASNISKVVRLYAHPYRYGKNIGDVAKLDSGPDAMLNLKGEHAEVKQLPPEADMAGSAAFLQFLRQSLFDITQTVDISSMADKLGALTNFGLRVLYQDSLAKLGVKRELYGDALLELARRILVIGEMENTNPGKIVWPDALPVDEVSQGTALKNDRDLMIVSKQTMATRRGYDWKVEEERLSAEQVASDNIGAMAIRNFNIGL